MRRRVADMTSVSLLTVRAESPAPATTAQAILAVARARARRLALRMRRIWESGQSSPDQGLAITPEEVARLLAGEADASVIQRADPEILALSRDVEIAEAALAADDRPTTASQRVDQKERGT